MKINVVYFTYRKDFELLKQSILSLEKQLENTDYKINVYDDQHFCFSDEQRKEIEQFKNILYWQTDHNRCGNLNGFDNLIAEAKIFENNKNADIIIKCDSDIIFGKTFNKYLNDFYNSDNDYSGCLIFDPKFKRSYFNGGCYLLKPTVTEYLLRDILDFPTYWTQAAEDYEICMRLRRNKDIKEDKSHTCFHQYFFNNISIEQESGYYLDPNFILDNNNKEIKNFIFNTSLWIACNDDLIGCNDKDTIKNAMLFLNKELDK